MPAAQSAIVFENPYNPHPDFFVGGTIERKLGDERHPYSGHRQFQFVDAVKVRKGRGAKETGARTLPAYEITLKVLGEDADALMQQVQAGQVFAFEPRNHRKDVANIKKLLGNPQNPVRVPVRSAYIASEGEQTVSVDDALSGVVDLSAPSLALVRLLDERVKAVGGAFLEKKEDAAAVVRSYTVGEVLAYAQKRYREAIENLPFEDTQKAAFPHSVLNLRDLVLNQPPMNARPYTLSHFNRETGEIKIVVGDVAHTLSAENPFNLQDQNGKPLGERVKRDGNATAMLRWMRLHNARKGPFTLGGSVDVEHPKLAFPELTEYTESIRHARHMTHENAQGERQPMVENPATRTAQVDMLANPASPYHPQKPVETIYLVATGTGIAPYLALLRDLKRKKDNGEILPDYRIVLTMGGRFQQDKIAHKELCGYVDEGLLEAYHFVSSSDQKEYIKTRNGEKRLDHAQTVKPAGWQGPVKYAQHALAYHYKDRMRGELLRDGAYVYLCGTKRAEAELTQLCPEKLSFGEDSKRPVALFGTASLPTRFRDNFNHSHSRPHEESRKGVLELIGVVKRLAAQRPWTERVTLAPTNVLGFPQRGGRS